MATRYLTALRGFLDRRRPGYLVFFVTPYCNCRCKMCFNMEAIEHASTRHILDLDEIRAIARNFQGLHQVNFSGGEPFLRNDFAEIPPLFYEHSGSRFFTCATNSTMPERVEKVVDEITRRCPKAWMRITQSLDGVGALHDEIRGKPGLFESVLELNGRLSRLKKSRPNLSIGVSMALSKFNQDHGFEVMDYVFDNLDFSEFGVLYVRGQTNDPEAGKVDATAYCRLQQEALRRSRRHVARRGLSGRLFMAINQTVCQLVMKTVTNNAYLTPCQAGRRMIIMDDEGNIEPCEVLRSFVQHGFGGLSSAAFGNVRDYDYDIRKVIQTPIARRIIKAIRRENCFCTFECAMAVNILYNAWLWPRILSNFLRVRS